jgi:hypothetical protein
MTEAAYTNGNTEIGNGAGHPAVKKRKRAKKLGRVRLADVLKQIPANERQGAFEAAMREIHEIEHRASLQKQLMDKIEAMPSDMLERLINLAVST